MVRSVVSGRGAARASGKGNDDPLVKILLVEDDPVARDVMADILSTGGYEVVSVSSGEQALDALRSEGDFAVAVVDIVLGGMDGMAFIRRANSLAPDTYVIAVSGKATGEVAAEAIRSGAFDFIAKPFPAVDLLRVVSESLRDRAQTLRNVSVVPGPVEGDVLLGESPAMSEVFRNLARISAGKGNVVVSGESGTGRTLVARAVHRFSRGRKGVFLSVDCAGPESEVGKELFGDAAGGVVGRLERASRGSLYLRNANHLTGPLQRRLLSILIKEEEAPSPDFPRIISALPPGDTPGSLQPDLYFRLANFRICLPPLRERREDVPLLADYFRRFFNYKHGRAVAYFPQDVMDALSAYDWPGNVMELRNAVERMVLQCAGAVPSPFDLPEEIRSAWEKIARPEPADVSLKTVLSDVLSSGEKKPLQAVVRRVKKLVAEQALASSGGDFSKAAAMLGTTRQVLRRVLENNGKS